MIVFFSLPTRLKQLSESVGQRTAVSRMTCIRCHRLSLQEGIRDWIWHRFTTDRPFITDTSPSLWLNPFLRFSSAFKVSIITGQRRNEKKGREVSVFNFCWLNPMTLCPREFIGSQYLLLDLFWDQSPFVIGKKFPRKEFFTRLNVADDGHRCIVRIYSWCCLDSHLTVCLSSHANISED